MCACMCVHKKVYPIQRRTRSHFLSGTPPVAGIYCWEALPASCRIKIDHMMAKSKLLAPLGCWIELGFIKTTVDLIQ